MREILFRGKDKKTNEWVYGDLIQTPDNTTRIIGFTPTYSDGIYSYKDYNVLVDKETIGQFTGLEGKNGVKIFEGDYIGWFGNKNKDDFFKYAEDGLLKKVNKYGEFSLSTAEVYNNGNLEVIGNIHDK